MANCQDLVNAVTAIKNSLQFEDPDDSNHQFTIPELLYKIKQLLEADVVHLDPVTGTPIRSSHSVAESAHRITSSLEQRMPSRAMTVEFMQRLIEVLQYNADAISERLAQYNALYSGNSAIHSTGVTDTVALDKTKDTDTVEKG